MKIRSVLMCTEKGRTDLHFKVLKTKGICEGALYVKCCWMTFLPDMLKNHE